jgi:hypothetical protein
VDGHADDSDVFSRCGLSLCHTKLHPELPSASGCPDLLLPVPYRANDWGDNVPGLLPLEGFHGQLDAAVPGCGRPRPRILNRAGRLGNVYNLLRGKAPFSKELQYSAPPAGLPQGAAIG